MIFEAPCVTKEAPPFRVAYVGPVSLPHGGAAARRMIGIAKSLQRGGIEVLFGSGQMAGPEGVLPLDFDGLPVYSLNERTSENFPVWLKHLSYMSMGKKTRRWLASLDPQPDAVILYAGFLPYFLNLSGWCRKHQIPLLFDAVEWYDPKGMPGGRYGPYRWSFELAMRWYAVRSGNIIAISRYLEQYFAHRGCRTLRIPPTLQVETLPAPKSIKSSGGLKVVYCGRPGKKDRLDLILEAVILANKHNISVQIEVAGVSPDELRSYPAICSRGHEIPDCILAHGDVSHAASMDLVRDADFSILIRDDARVSQAGFPTKVVESLALGTPVITNLTSDLGLYLKDGVNSLICRDASVGELIKSLRRADQLPWEQHQSMRIAARDCAQQNFDSTIYTECLAAFVRTCHEAQRKVDLNVH